MEGSGTVEFRVLGPLQVLVDDRPVPLGGAKQRLTLAALLLHANAVVSADRLADILWGDLPPDSALSTLQKYVYRLRGLIEPGRGSRERAERLITQAPGYLLRVGTDQLDSARFHDLLTRARHLASGDELEQATACLDEALGLWRGPAWAEFADHEVAGPDVTRLEDLRILALEERAEIGLAAGRHAELIGQLEATAARYPWRERPHAQLMLALYRSGRHAEALRAYQRLRDRVGEELGIEPSAELVRLEEAILLQKPELDWPGFGDQAARLDTIDRPATPRRSAVSYQPAPGSPSTSRPRLTSCPRPSELASVGSSVRFVRTADGVRVPVEVEGTGAFLVFVRGWITHLELQRNDPAMEAFFGPIREHRTLVRYDTRGNGLADRELPSPPDLDALVDDLSAVIDSLPENDAIELWGSTYGGPIALTYAARHPERVSHLILDGTYARGSDILPGDSADQFLEMLDLARHQPNVVYSSLSYMTDPEPQIGHDARVRRLRRSIDPDSLVDLYRLGFSVDVSRLLPTIHMPTLVLHRTRTRSVPFREGRNLAAELPNAKLVALEGRAHNLWEEQPAAALSAIGEFLGIDGLTVGSPHLVAPAPVGESVVVMFTDICGSTELTGRLGDDAAHQIVRAHNTVVRRSITRFGSKEIKHTGDGIFASFRSATSALGAAAMIQSAASDLRHSGDVPDLAIRIGLNAGEPIVEEDDLFGSVVQIAARVCSVASPDEVLVTSVVKELAAGRQFRFLDRCDQSLRGVADPVHLWALARPTTNRPDPISVP